MSIEHYGINRARNRNTRPQYLLHKIIKSSHNVVKGPDTFDNVIAMDIEDFPTQFFYPFPIMIMTRFDISDGFFV